MSYDRDMRRDTPLARRLKERIRRDGPISVPDYVSACLYDEEHGYYRQKPAIGADGDFITAPEISQVFGEIIGLWCAVVWQQMGAPSPFNLIEYGPGRGTLMRDALRAMRTVPGCLKAAKVRLSEINPLLRQRQREALSPVPVAISWHKLIAEEVPKLPSILLGNEFLDVQVAEQFVLTRAGCWAVRTVALDGGGQLAFATGRDSLLDWLDDRCPSAQIGNIAELRELPHAIAYDMVAFPRAAALFIDYGHAKTQPGDTLQAVRDHKFEHPLTSPGEADLSCQVDFDWLGLLAGEADFRVDGPVTQAEFLGSLGIVERAQKLMAANPAKAGQIETGVARLIAPQGMGSRFKAIGIRSPQLPPLPGFPAVDSGIRAP